MNSITLKGCGRAAFPPLLLQTLRERAAFVAKHFQFSAAFAGKVENHDNKEKMEQQEEQSGIIQRSR